jgi:hypothetical protein
VRECSFCRTHLLFLPNIGDARAILACVSGEG